MGSLDIDENKSQFLIRAYQPGTLKINDKTFNQSLIITPSKLIENWSPQMVTEITTHSFDLIMELKPDILLIGTGAKQVFIASELYGSLINQGIGVEIMSTQAACRTFNALSSENRNVAAALIIR